MRTARAVGAETAASVIFAREIKEAANPDEVRAKRISEYGEIYENPYCGAERGYIDDVIMPHSTRRRLARALAMLKNKHVEMPSRKHDNLPV